MQRGPVDELLGVAVECGRASYSPVHKSRQGSYATPDTIRERQQFTRKIAGLTATGRASAKVLIGLPAFLACALTLMNHEYMRPLWHGKTGHMLIVASLVMTTIGALILRKMVNLKT